MIDQKQLKDLEIYAAEIRLGAMDAMSSFKMGHVGGAMSIVEVLAVLYGCEMNVDPADPKKEDRDYMVLSKGHAGPALYAALAYKGYFPVEELKTLNQNGTRLPSHCSRMHTPGIDATTGSLGTGISVAAGLALASKIKGQANRTFCIIGDGEMDEGQIWEGILFAAAKKLDNFVLFIDYNKFQLDGSTESICDLGDIAAKLKTFGYDVQDVNGHDVAAVYEAVEASKEANGRPKAVVLNTVKGYGSKMAMDIAARGSMNHAFPFTDPEATAAEMARHEKVLADLKAEREAM